MDRASIPNDTSELKKSAVSTILNTQIERLWVLSASLPKERSQLTHQEHLDVSDLPLTTLEELSLHISSLLFDAGRTNSYILRAKGSTIFLDHYHRESAFNQRDGFSLVKNSCVLDLPDPSVKGIPFTTFLRPVVYNFFSTKIKEGTPYSFEAKKIRYFKKHIEQIWLVITPTHLVDKTLHYLGMLGALPNRDWQSWAFTSLFDLMSARELYMRCITSIYVDQLPLQSTNYRIELNHSLKEQKQLLLTTLEKQQEHYPSGMEQEQRLFYSRFLTKLIQSLSLLDDDDYKLPIKIQLSASFSRIQKLIHVNPGLEYPDFLRTLEACIDELLIAMSLHKRDNPSFVEDVLAIVKQFIVDTVGFNPAVVGLRASAMQAIWESLQTTFYFFTKKQGNVPVNVYVASTIYFEVTSVLFTLFKAPFYRHENSLSMAVCPDLSDNNSVATLIPENDTVYDLYIANFESNIQFKKRQTQFLDINDFVEKQFQLRKDLNLRNRPLVVLIDNTMSNFDDTYLPFFLMQFSEEIDQGLLCVLMSHSGNKYMHLGTDKEPAALCSGFFDPNSFPIIHAQFSSRVLGDFQPDSPTILLTQAFLRDAKEDILSFNLLIRQRTRYLFSTVIPDVLKENQGYFSIHNPISNATYQGLPAHCTTLQNCCGFITICQHSAQFFPGTIHEQMMDMLGALLRSLEVYGREGFAFSQTTNIIIEPPELPCICRISIGTESLAKLEKMMEIISDFLLQANAIMEPYRCQHKNVVNQTIPDSILDAVQKAFQSATNLEHFTKLNPKNKYIKTSAEAYGFFATKNGATKEGDDLLLGKSIDSLPSL